MSYSASRSRNSTSTTPNSVARIEKPRRRPASSSHTASAQRAFIPSQCALTIECQRWPRSTLKFAPSFYLADWGGGVRAHPHRQFRMTPALPQMASVMNASHFSATYAGLESKSGGRGVKTLKRSLESILLPDSQGTALLRTKRTEDRNETLQRRERQAGPVYSGEKGFCTQMRRKSQRYTKIRGKDYRCKSGLGCNVDRCYCSVQVLYLSVTDIMDRGAGGGGSWGGMEPAL